jgi:hypothetical protein
MWEYTNTFPNFMLVFQKAEIRKFVFCFVYRIFLLTLPVSYKNFRKLYVCFLIFSQWPQSMLFTSQKLDFILDLTLCFGVFLVRWPERVFYVPFPNWRHKRSFHLANLQFILTFCLVSFMVYVRCVLIIDLFDFIGLLDTFLLFFKNILNNYKFRFYTPKIPIWTLNQWRRTHPNFNSNFPICCVLRTFRITSVEFSFSPYSMKRRKLLGERVS